MPNHRAGDSDTTPRIGPAGAGTTTLAWSH
jgi:hypothetical protein